MSSCDNEIFDYLYSYLQRSLFMNRTYISHDSAKESGGRAKPIELAWKRVKVAETDLFRSSRIQSTSILTYPTVPLNQVKQRQKMFDSIKLSDCYGELLSFDLDSFLESNFHYIFFFFQVRFDSFIKSMMIKVNYSAILFHLL